MRRLMSVPLVAAALLGLAPEPLSVSSAGAVASQAWSPQAGVVQPAPVVARPEPPSIEVLQLQRDLQAIAGTSGSRSGAQGILVVSLDRGDTLFALNPDMPLAPASNMKLYTTAAALYYLGPEFRYSTYALADGEIVDGILYGDLILYGTGDPAISSRMLPGALTPLRALADSLVANGIREITGNVIGDGSYFDDQWIGNGWKEQYRLDTYSAPVGALSLAENVVSLGVVPGAPGEPAQIRTTPETSGLLINNRVTTVSSGGTRIRFAYDPTGLVIEGQIVRGHPGVARTLPVTDPANYAAAAFRSVLEEAGVKVGGSVNTIRVAAASPIRRGERTQGDDSGSPVPPRVVGIHLSPSLREVVTVTNHFSQNLYAEALFKTVGRVVLGEGSFEAGARAVQYFLECEKPFDFTGMNLVDGSGLSPDNRVTARSTVHLLDLMRRTEVGEVFMESLPMAASRQGGAHSLRNRMAATPAANNLRAKTGTISNVSSLSGYVRAANGELLAFSILVNDVPSTYQAKRMEDAIGSRLARFTRPIRESAAEFEVEEPVEEPIGPALEGLEAESAPAVPPVAVEPAPVEIPAAPSARTHRVRSGETLDGIARSYGISVTELQRANPGVQPRRLQIGQVLTIP